MSKKMKWLKGGTPTETQHFLQTDRGLFTLVRFRSRSGYQRRGIGAGADWDVWFSSGLGQGSVRVGQITGLHRAKLYAEGLAEKPCYL